jgi:hypothetical protein
VVVGSVVVVDEVVVVVGSVVVVQAVVVVVGSVVVIHAVVVAGTVVVGTVDVVVVVEVLLDVPPDFGVEGAAATGGVASDVPTVDPFLLFAVTLTRIAEPTSVGVSR